MHLTLQNEIQKLHPMFGIDSSLPVDGIKPGRLLPAWVNDGPLYEIFVRNFSPQGTFAGIETRISYFKELGVKTIWLMPVHPIGKENRKGKLGSPYAIQDHMSLNPDYGREKDFKHLVDALHDHDMRIIIDMVLNHGAADHIKYDTDPEMFNREFLRSPEDWWDVREFNYNNPDMGRYACDILKYWVQEYNIDGYRCDVAGLVPLKIWEEAVDSLIEIKPDIYMLAEWQNRALHNNTFHSTYDWTSYLLMKDVYAGQRPAHDLLIWEQQWLNGYPGNARPLKFTENHDLPRTLYTFKGDRYQPFTAFTYFVKGVPLIYNGQEIGLSEEPSLFEKSTMDWDVKNEQIIDFYKKLIQIRYNHKSVFDGEFKNIQNDRSDRVVSFLRSDQKDKLIIVINFSDEEISVKLNMMDTFKNSKYTDLIVNTKKLFEADNVRLTANQVLVLKVQDDGMFSIKTKVGQSGTQIY